MLTSIIILTHNKIQFTRFCIESIRAFTPKDAYELIVVDNGSEAETVEYLRAQTEIKVIYNKENLGFPKGCNQGIEIASGDTILLLNNDVIVTPNWLTNLVSCLYSCENIGAVGPVTNSCSNNQAIEISYKSLKELLEFGQMYNQQDPGQWELRPRLVGYCMLIKKFILDEIGLLDERFSPGNYEDDDLSFRIREAGYQLVLCKDTFIHHFGSASFGENREKFMELLQKNRRKFEEKWGERFNAFYGTVGSLKEEKEGE